jgi:cytochrome c553
MKLLLHTTALALLLGALPATQAADAERGKQLVKDNCTSCHDDSVYSRKDRRVTSLDGLKKQVKRCELNLGLRWFDEDIQNVVGYLNKTYYKF